MVTVPRRLGWVGAPGIATKCLFRTIVVSSASSFTSARIWHVCDGNQQLERGRCSPAFRAIFRHNDQVVTFFRQTRVAVAEARESLGLFPIC